jgi:uracil-DNA glycosylase
MNIREQLGEEWYKVLKREFSEDYMKKIRAKLKYERQRYDIYPAPEDVFRAFRTTPLSEVRVVIIGQDPYHTPEVADGLAFSTRRTLTRYIPPSLKNIFTELERDIDFETVEHNPDLTRWAKQGILLLNTSLTVRKKDAGSHSQIGWRRFTRKALRHIANRFEPTIFVMWGRHAQAIGDQVIERKNTLHLKIKSAHPSPFSANRGFFGSEPFSRINRMLKQDGFDEIDWMRNE